MGQARNKRQRVGSGQSFTSLRVKTALSNLPGKRRTTASATVARRTTLRRSCRHHGRDRTTGLEVAEVSCGDLRGPQGNHSLSCPGYRVRACRTPCGACVLHMWGIGANGKTTLINALQAVLGQSVVGQIECELFLRNNGIRSSSTARPDLLALRGMRLAVASETGEGRHIDAAELKRLTGRDKLTGRTLYSAKIVTWEPTHTVWQLTNHRPASMRWTKPCGTGHG